MTPNILLRICGALITSAVIGFWAGPAIAQTPFDSTFDHFTTGWPLEGAHRNADCSRCHVGGVFQGTSRECGDCHALAGLVQATPLPPDHVRINGTQCQDCHFDTSWSPVSRVDHASLSGDCGDCHNNVIATGKNPGHVLSGDNCEACHVTTAWLPAFFFHDNVAPGSCNDCHAGDKNPGHLMTTESCDACHVTTGWLPAFFDHSGVAPGSCNSCHAGDQNPGHFITTQSCDDCHVTSAWLPDTFVHMSAAYPGDHAQNLDCVACHNGNSVAVTWPAPAYQPDCAACHVNDFRPGPHKIYENPDTFYSVGQLSDCSGACHIYTDATLTTIKEFRPGPEHRVNSNDF